MMELYHVTTEKKARKYRETGYIRNPVRGFITFLAAMAWAVKTGRRVIYRVDGEPCYKLPEHHNRFGEAWWCDANVPVSAIECVFSAEKDA